jgi:hypothetical protein
MTGAIGNDSKKQQMEDFFELYCNIFNWAIKEDVPDIEQTAKLYSDCFIAANPAGVNCGKNDEQFRVAMLKGYAFYRNIGITSMKIVSKEITSLDDIHTMVKIHWKSDFIKKEGSKGSIEFANIYFVQTKEHKHKVFAYITGDEQAVLKKFGLI